MLTVNTKLVTTVGDLLPMTWVGYLDWEYVAELVLKDFKETPNDPERLTLEVPGGMVQRVLTIDSETTKADLTDEIEDYMAKAWRGIWE